LLHRELGVVIIMAKKIPDWLPRVLTKRAAYKVAELAVRAGLYATPRPASRRMLLQGLRATADALAGKGPAAWTTAFFPTEILYAMGITPFSPEVASALLASLGYGDQLLEVAEQHHSGRDNCTFHRLADGVLQSGLLPPPDVYLASTTPCDGAPALWQTMADRTGRPGFLLHVPLDEGEEGLAYLEQQLRKLVEMLEGMTGRRLTGEGLQRALANVNRTREAMLKVEELRAAYDTSFHAREAISYLYLYYTGMGSLDTALVYEELARDLQEEVKAGAPAAGKDGKIRLLWLHLQPFYPHPIYDILDELGARVVFEEFNQVYWPELDPEEGLRALGRRTLNCFASGPVERRVRHILRLVDKFKPQGAIHFSHWGCRQSCGGVWSLRSALRERGVPLLDLDGDCIDSRNFSPGQVRTRLEGFIELLNY